MNSFTPAELVVAPEFTVSILQAMQDSAQAAEIESAYDSVLTAEVPVADLSPLESIMLAEDKLYVVLAVVLIIWFGIVLMLVRTDRKIKNLERRVADQGSGASDTATRGN